MPTTENKCPNCGGTLQEGIILDRPGGYNGVIDFHQARWQAGKPEKSWWTGSIKACSAKQKPLVALRCENCTAVQLFAP